MRRVYRVISLMAVFAWLNLTAAAWAINLTGTWAGTQVCQEFDGKARTRTFPNDEMAVSQSGNGLFLFTPLAGVFHAQVIEDAERPASKANAIFTACSTTEASTYQELGRATTLRVTTRGSETRFEALSNFFQADPDGYRFMGTCVWNYRRVDTADPKVGDCHTPSGAAVLGSAPAGRTRP
ncbi:MAG TPA: hypothetical protein VKJ47_10565 [Candidatus Binatia bacterium]|nr:hypothetical protein [Candidatus Binatia bacterium]